jgi:hypothetical protein
MAANLLSTDTNLANRVVFKIGTDAGDANTIKFQFPPKILSDNRSGTWIEAEIPGDQPVQIWKTSGARKFVLEWTYIIGVNNWSTEKVRGEIIKLRNYYTRKGPTATADDLIVFFKMWKFGGDKEMTCRLGAINVSHGKALYIPNDGSEPTNDQLDRAHPVVTNIKVDMQLWTRGNATEAETNKRTDASGKTTTSDKIDIKGLLGAVPTEWQ